MTKSLSRLGVILDRAAQLITKYAGSIAICMIPALALSIVASALKPGALTLAIVEDNNGGLSSYVRAYWVYAGGTVVATFSLWVCAASVMIGVRWIERGYSPAPKLWMKISTLRIPALLATFFLPLVPALVPLALWILSLAGFAQYFAAADPATFDYELKLARFEYDSAVLLAVLGLPVAYLASANVMLGDLSAFKSIVASVRWSFSRRHATRFFAIAFAILALLAAQ